MENQWKHFAAMVLIGDGVMAVINPRADAHAWKHGPIAWQKAMKELRKHPTLTRIIGLGQIAAGISIALAEDRSARRLSLTAASQDDPSEDAFVR
jgi:uncharacterized protein YjeT (DUF2065 family)